MTQPILPQNFSPPALSPVPFPSFQQPPSVCIAKDVGKNTYCSLKEGVTNHAIQTDLENTYYYINHLIQNTAGRAQASELMLYISESKLSYTLNGQRVEEDLGLLLETVPNLKIAVDHITKIVEKVLKRKIASASTYLPSRTSANVSAVPAKDPLLPLSSSPKQAIEKALELGFAYHHCFYHLDAIRDAKWRMSLSDILIEQMKADLNAELNRELQKDSQSKIVKQLQEKLNDFNTIDYFALAAAFTLDLPENVTDEEVEKETMRHAQNTFEKIKAFYTKAYESKRDKDVNISLPTFFPEMLRGKEDPTAVFDSTYAKKAAALVFSADPVIKARNNLKEFDETYSKIHQETLMNDIIRAVMPWSKVPTLHSYYQDLEDPAIARTLENKARQYGYILRKILSSPINFATQSHSYEHFKTHAQQQFTHFQSLIP